MLVHCHYTGRSAAAQLPQTRRAMTRSDEARSRIMRAVRSKDTTPELTVRRLIHKLGYRFRLHRKDLPGSPDLVFPGRRKAIFIHGCFWHGHDCKRGNREPKTNVDYWRNKIARNKARDWITLTTLKDAGWDIMTIWECQTSRAEQGNLTSRLVEFLGSAAKSRNPP